MKSPASWATAAFSAENAAIANMNAFFIVLFLVEKVFVFYVLLFVCFQGLTSGVGHQSARFQVAAPLVCYSIKLTKVITIFRNAKNGVDAVLGVIIKESAIFDIQKNTSFNIYFCAL